MADQFSQSIPKEKNQDELPEAKLLRAESLSRLGNPEVKAWRFSDLEQDDVKEQQELRADVLARVRKEIAPEVNRQTTLLKKEAFEKAHKEGYDAGFQKGLEQGKKQAYEEAQQKADAQLQPQVERIISLLSFLKRPYQALEQQVVQSYADLAITLAEKMIKDHARDSEAWVVEAVKASVELLAESSAPIEIELNPQDIDIITKYQNDFDQAWLLKKNADLPLGSCRVKQDFSIIDNIWQERLADLLKETRHVIQQISSHPSDTGPVLDFAESHKAV